MTKILIVEDEAITAMDIKNRLNNYGLEVVGIAARGNEAIEKAEQLKPDIILMDIILKGDMDGIEAAEEIKALFDIPVIYMSAFADENTFEKIKFSNPYGFINKPINSDMLIVSIDAAVYKHEINKKLAESEEKFRVLSESSPIGIVVYRGSNHLYVNSAAVSIFEYPNEELLEMNFIDLAHPDYKEMVMDKAKARMNGNNEPANYQVKMITKSGKEKWLDVSTSRIQYEGSPAGIVTFSDITKNKKAEEELKESEANYRNFFNNPLMGFALCEIITDEDGEPTDFVYLQVNDAFKAYTGLKKDEVLNKKVTEVLKPEEVADIIKIYGKVALTGESTQFEYPIPSLNKYYQIAAFSPSKRRFIAFFTDITEHKRIEDELRQAHDNLEQKVEERTVEIEEAYQIVKENELKLKETIKELEHSNAELQSFAYITSHDLQEPLRTIASFTQLLQRRYKKKLDSDADEFIDYIVSASIRMKSMIQGLLEYSRIDSARKEFIKTDMNVKVEKAVSNLEFAVSESNAQITHDNLPKVFADPDQMVRVFQNLISNAIKYKKLQLPPRIHISASTDSIRNKWVFSVKDNGIGMDPQYSSKIFEVFKRLHTIDQYEGTGIGLAVVKRIIDRHGGRVWVESEFGRGSTFYFTIPINSQNKDYEQTKFQSI